MSHLAVLCQRRALSNIHRLVDSGFTITSVSFLHQSSDSPKMKPICRFSLTHWVTIILKRSIRKLQLHLKNSSQKKIIKCKTMNLFQISLWDLMSLNFCPRLLTRQSRLGPSYHWRSITQRSLRKSLAKNSTRKSCLWQLQFWSKSIIRVKISMKIQWSIAKTR